MISFTAIVKHFVILLFVASNNRLIYCVNAAKIT